MIIHIERRNELLSRFTSGEEGITDARYIDVKLSDGQRFSMREVDDGEGPRLIISAQNGRLAIEPRAANNVRIQEQRL